MENTRLQQMVDILDSQPELIFCINARGDITYISERTINFVSMTNAADETDVEPSHISQILAKDSVESVLKTIQEIMKVSPPKSALAESSMLFSAKVSNSLIPPPPLYTFYFKTVCRLWSFRTALATHLSDTCDALELIDG